MRGGDGWCVGRAGVVMGSVLLLVLLLSPHQTQAGPVAKRNIDSMLEGKDKRPFCNAFTGCGKKRSDPEMDNMASVSELDALAKHVLAEAKLWEQLQNKMEMMRSLAARMESHPLYRKKRSPVNSSSSSPTHSAQLLTHKTEDVKHQ
ncbi:hypothetical protein Pmani_029570 [Petrolisthes manimaculis]|uniref:Crustacean cardioactive peptide n=1 Tax=Petrolisthes manimaculis TaxID=1843537 RepID=A0AAE1TUB7_9EUCA|nr:hypothetical protein Pmani_029570 [Petrolisthes manimaculis]